MLLKSYELNGREPIIVAVSTLILMLTLLYQPVAFFIAELRFSSIETILDNKTTEVLDTKNITTRAMPDYLKAVEMLKRASALEPSRAQYHRSLGDYYMKLGKWAQGKEQIGLPLPQGALSSKDAYESAMAELKQAIELEPADPDHHLAMGTLLDAMKADPALSEKEYERAAQAFPVNAPLRYAIIQQYVNTGRSGAALEHTRILALIDDTYKLSDKVDKKEILETRPRYYLTKISKSFLFYALEIAWSVSKDVQVVKGIVPENDEAKVVSEYFFELNNIDN